MAEGIRRTDFLQSNAAVPLERDAALLCVASGDGCGESDAMMVEMPAAAQVRARAMSLVVR